MTVAIRSSLKVLLLSVVIGIAALSPSRAVQPDAVFDNPALKACVRAFLEGMRVNTALLGRVLFGGEPHILALTDRAGGPQFFQRADERGDLRVGMHW